MNQAARARKPRGKTADGRTIGEIVGKLIRKPELLGCSAKELWPHFYAALEEAGLDPQEEGKVKSGRSAGYSYEYRGRRKSISFKHFANAVSDLRKNQSE